jgi:hypothetical protein
MSIRSTQGAHSPSGIWKRFGGSIAIAAILAGLFATQVQAAVPANGRTWELTTLRPPSSSKFLGLRPLGQGGDQLAFGTIGPPPGTDSGALLGYDIATRGQSEWTDTPFGLPYFTESTRTIFLFAPILPIAFSEDLDTALWLSGVSLTEGGPPGAEGLALYRDRTGQAPEPIAKIVEEGLPLFGPGGFADMASDGSRVVFTSEEHLLPGDAGRTQGESVYAWNGSGMELVDVDDGGALLSTCGSRISKANGMSASANRVFFTVPPLCGGLEKVYVRNLETKTTVEISASECTRLDCNAAADVTFAGATPDGKFAYLTTTQQLTNEDHDSLRDLYRYDVATGELTLLSGAPSEVTGEVIQATVYPSENGARVYLRATGEMLPGELTTGEKLFLADGSGLHLVAKAGFPFEPEVQLSADGKRALFVTQTQVLPGDTESQADVYLYDAEGETLTRVSTGPSGGNGAFPASIEVPSPLNRHEFEFGNLRPYYAIDAAGDRVFFTTEESLVPEDTNGKFDVYEWVNGEVGLVTPGNQPLESSFAGISRDGRSVMFATNATIVPSDEDGEGRDLYDARLEGGFPPGPEPAKCNDTSCPLPAGTRITRHAPASVIPIRRKHGRLRVLDVAPKAKKGAIAVLVSVPSPGPVSGLISAREGGRKVVLAHGSTGAIRSGKVRLALRLTSSALRSAAGAVQAQLTVNEGSEKVSQAVKVSLR